MKNLAPIILFVYNRLDHTTKTVEALKKNPLAKDSTLYIFSDGAKNEAASTKVNSVREYIKSIDGFKEIIIREQERNLGLAASVISGVTEVVNRYGKIIVLEDDIITAPSFLEYMNSALDMYEDEDSVATIYGYLPRIEKKLPETFFLKGSGCWGWATWKRAWAIFNPDGKQLLKEIYDKKLAKRFDFDNSFYNVRMLKEYIYGENQSWAIRWNASILVADKYSLNPGRSLTKNIGNDSSGTHDSGYILGYDVETTDRPIVLTKEAVEESKDIYKAFVKFYRKYLPMPWTNVIELIKAIIRWMLPYGLVRFYFLQKKRKLLK